MGILASKKPVFLLLVLVVILGIGGWMWYGNLTQPQSAVRPSEALNISQSIAPQKPQEIMVTIPGTAPFLALKEDYDSDTSLWRVVSKDYPFTNPHYIPSELQFATVASRTDKSTSERSLRKDIMPSVEQLFAAAKGQGYDLMIGSGYRSYEQQNMYYTNYVKTYGQAQADTFSAQPGKSEHQSGLAMDVSYSDRRCYLDSCFGDTPAGQWLAAHAHEYGFILRYPKDKTAITKYIYEPWHFRYVGKDLAKALHETGLTLDEAIPYLQNALVKLKTAKAIP